MKKTIAAILTAAVIFTCCMITVHSEADLMSYSFDTIYVNDLDSPVVNNGQAKQWTEWNPIEAEITVIRVRGWAWLGSGSIAAFGYRIDDGVADIDEYYIFDRPDVWGAFGVEKDEANGFDITMDVSGVAPGEHLVTLLLKAIDGTIIELTDFYFTQKLGSTVKQGYLTFEDNGGYYVVSSCSTSASGTIAIPGSVTANGKTQPVKRINYGAFNDCDRILTIIIPDSIEYINYSSFKSCSSLTSVEVDRNNTEYASLDGVLFSKDLKWLEFYPSAKSGDYTVPAGVTEIGWNSFWDCSKLTGLTIGDNVEYIYENTIKRCPELKSVTFGSGVTYIANECITNCPKLEKLSVSKANGVFHSAGNCIIETESKRLVLGCKGSVIPNDGSVTSIGAAFAGCTSLTSIKIPGTVTDITYYSFSECSNLKDITIPSSVKTIGEGVFYGCSSLETVHYGGSEDQWKDIRIFSLNYPLENARIIFNSAMFTPGDCNNDGLLDNKDVVLLFRYVSGALEFDDDSACDFNNDGTVDNKDVVSLFRYVSSLV